jgi:DNA-binding HxlR family transcriptional regulator
MQHRVYYCPVEVTMELIGGKWTSVILAHIKEQPRRFSELRRLIPDVSEKMLTQRLRSLETDGLLNRAVVSNTPPHVVYDLTPAGRTLAPALQALYDWGQMWAAAHGLAVEHLSG